MIGGVITRPEGPRLPESLRSAFWTLFAAACLLTLTDWCGEICTAVIAGTEGFRQTLPSRYCDTAHSNVTYG